MQNESSLPKVTDSIPVSIIMAHFGPDQLPWNSTPLLPFRNSPPKNAKSARKKDFACVVGRRDTWHESAQITQSGTSPSSQDPSTSSCNRALTPRHSSNLPSPQYLSLVRIRNPPSWAPCSKRIHQLTSLQNPLRQRCRNQLSLPPSRQTATIRDNRSRPTCHIRRWHLNTAPPDRRTCKLENRGIFRIPLPGSMPTFFLRCYPGKTVALQVRSCDLPQDKQNYLPFRNPANHNPSRS